MEGVQIHHFVPLMLASLSHHVSLSRSDSRYWILLQVAISIALWLLPPRSILCLWRPTMAALKLWTKFPGVKSLVPAWVIQGGPLGHGCSKIVEVITVIILWKLAYPQEDLPLSVGLWPSFLSCVLVLMLAVTTNLVLTLWSSYHHSRGDHVGVNAMVQSSMGRTLTVLEHARLAMLGIINAVAEELSSRGFWLHEFVRRGDLSFHQANMCQAISFGVWHYHGIPSGMTGVALTTLYGYIMGLLFQHGGGLLLPIVTHSLADYFIFAVIARRGGLDSAKTRKQEYSVELLNDTG